MYTENVTAAAQLSFFAMAAAVGFGLGILYDIFRVLRTVSPKSKILTVVCDVLFMALAAPVSFIFTVIVNNGTVRGYILLGELLGFIIYMRSFGRLSGFVFRLIRKLILKLLFVIFYPLRLLLRLFSKIFLKTSKKLKKIIKSLLKTGKELVYNDSKQAISAEAEKH